MCHSGQNTIRNKITDIKNGGFPRHPYNNIEWFFKTSSRFEPRIFAYQYTEHLQHYNQNISKPH